MPIVKIRPSHSKAHPFAPAPALLRLFQDQAGMDSEEAQQALAHLAAGKSIEAFFDFGEDLAAAEFARAVTQYGLHAEVEAEPTAEPLWKEYERLIFPFLAFVGVIVFYSELLHGPGGRVTMALMYGTGLTTLSLLILAVWHEQKYRNEPTPFWNTRSGGTLILMIAAIFVGVWGIAIVPLIVGSLLCAVIVHRISQR